MCQQKVLKCLEENREPLTVNEIAKKLKAKRGSIQRSLKSMAKYNEVKRVTDEKEYYYQIN